MGAILKIVKSPYINKQSSSAVAERPRDASCLSVVSFNSTKRRLQSFIVSYIATNLSLRANKCCSVVFGVALRLLLINISSLSPAINKLRLLLPAISVTTCGTVVRRRRLITLVWSQRWQHAEKPDIDSESRFLPTPPAFDPFDPSLEYCHAV